MLYSLHCFIAMAIGFLLLFTSDVCGCLVRGQDSTALCGVHCVVSTWL